MLYALLVGAAAEAQLVRVGVGGGRVSVVAPGVGVGVSPWGGVSVRAPGAYVRTPGYYAPRTVVVPRGVVVGPPAYGYYRGSVSVNGGGYSTYESSGSYQSGTIETPVYGVPTPAITGEVASNPLPSGFVTASAEFGVSADLAEMSAEELGAEISVASAALQARLDLFNGGEGWQTYFKLPGDLASETEGAAKLLRRFDSVARQGEFASIANLAEFSRLHELLTAYVAVTSEQQVSPAPDGSPAAAPATGVRVEAPGVSVGVQGGNVGVQAGGVGVSVQTGGESIPAPTPSGERSILIETR